MATWNVQEGLPVGSVAVEDRAGALASMVETLRRYPVDILAMQEVDFDADGRSQVLDALRRGTDLVHTSWHALDESSFFPGQRAGVAVASRLPIERQERFLMPNPRLRTVLGGRPIVSHDKGGVVCAVRLGRNLVHLVCLHMFPFHVFRREADEPEFWNIWLDLRNRIHALAGTGGAHPVIVAGDFNTARRELVVGPDLRLGRAVGDEHRTHKDFAADDILFSPPLHLDTPVEVLPNFSDHQLCVARLGVR